MGDNKQHTKYLRGIKKNEITNKQFTHCISQNSIKKLIKEFSEHCGLINYTLRKKVK